MRSEAPDVPGAGIVAGCKPTVTDAGTALGSSAKTVS